MARVLIVEDDEAIMALLGRYLRSEGYEVLEARDGAEGLLRAPQADLLLLDIELPLLNGIDIAANVRKEYPDVPIIMVTGRSEQDARLMSFDAGVDDYVMKPFDLLELGARMRAVLRRSGYRDELTCGELRIDFPSRRVFLNGEVLSLSRLEFDLLTILARNPNTVFSRDRLLHQVWGSDYDGGDRTIDVRIAALRRKLLDSSEKPRYIEAVRGIGYRFCFVSS